MPGMRVMERECFIVGYREHHCTLKLIKLLLQKVKYKFLPDLCNNLVLSSHEEEDTSLFHHVADVAKEQECLCVNSRF